MSLQQAPQSRVFVELVPWADRGRENHPVSAAETLPGLRCPPSSAAAPTAPREVHVTGSAEVSAGPDRARVAVRLSSTKAAAAEARRSVGRRLDYVTQSLRRQGVQVGARAGRGRGGGGARGRGGAGRGGPGGGAEGVPRPGFAPALLGGGLSGGRCDW